MKRLALVIALLAACKGDDPYAGGAGGESCEPGSFRDPGPGCTAAPLPALTVDGKATEWQGDRLQFIHAASCCNNGDPAELHIGRVSDGSALGMFMPIAGTANLSGNFDYVVHFRRHGMFAGQPGDQSFEIVVTPTAVYPSINGTRIYGIAIDHAFGPDGLELKVPIDALPFPGIAYVEAWLVSTSNGNVIDPPPFSSIACWDPTSPDSSCSFF